MATAKKVVTEEVAEAAEFKDLSMALFVNNYKRDGRKDPDYLVKTKLSKEDKNYLIVGSAWENMTAKGQKVISLRLNINQLKSAMPVGA